LSDLFQDQPTVITLEDGSATLYRDFYHPAEADCIFNALKKDTPWKQDTIDFKGNINPIPRLAAWYSKTERTYTYSGIKMLGNPYTVILDKLNNKVESLLGHPFNSVLLNYYRNGSDSVSWHADDEAELGDNIHIASVSLGAIRPFQLKRKDGIGNTVAINLTHGSLLAMEHPMQQYWLHKIPKRKNIVQPRINLTFRFLP
jgi:alkylated DNA repair dioxygenase AlkB